MVSLTISQINHFKYLHVDTKAEPKGSFSFLQLLAINQINMQHQPCHSHSVQLLLKQTKIIHPVAPHLLSGNTVR